MCVWGADGEWCGVDEACMYYCIVRMWGVSAANGACMCS